MSRTVSARIPIKTHEELVERCNRSGCTISEWIEASINNIFNMGSDFDFGDEEEKEDEPQPVKEAKIVSIE